MKNIVKAYLEYVQTRTNEAFNAYVAAIQAASNNEEVAEAKKIARRLLANR